MDSESVRRKAYLLCLVPAKLRPSVWYSSDFFIPGSKMGGYKFCTGSGLNQGPLEECLSLNYFISMVHGDHC